MPQVNVDNVIVAYLKLRDQRAQLKKEYDDNDIIVKGKMEKLEIWLMQQMQTSNATQLGSPNGTAYQQTVMKGNCSDWTSFWGFLRETGRFDMMEKRVSVKTIQSYYEETGQLPPGINVNPELRVVVRKT